MKLLQIVDEIYITECLCFKKKRLTNQLRKGAVYQLIAV